MKLFRPLTIKQTTIRNRVVMAPMCQYQADHQGFVQPWHLTHYSSRAVGGVGLIIVEATGIEARGRLSGSCLGVYHDEHVEGLRQIARWGKMHGAVMGIQLSHGGRKGHGPDLIGPSPISADPQRYPVPRPVAESDMGSLLQLWRQAARRAREAEFDMIQLHGAHGYLLHSFLSPLANRRQDGYGGSPANRRRLLLEVVEAVQEEWPAERLLSVRLSAVDYLPDGLSLDDTIATVKALKAAGVDLIDISSGGILPAVINAYPGYQVPLAAAVKAAVDMPTVAVGQLDAVDLAESVVASGDADFAALGRALLRDPHWVLRVAEQDPAVPWPQSYERARRNV